MPISSSCSCMRVTASYTHKSYSMGVTHFRETYIKQEQGESPNDRNDRAIRVGTAWYVQRLPQMKIFLLTNDAENRRKALSNHLDAMSVQVSVLLVCGAIIQQQGAFLSCLWCLWCPVCLSCLQCPWCLWCCCDSAAVCSLLSILVSSSWSRHRSVQM